MPTWNYVPVHVTGTVRILEEPDQIREILHELIACSDRHDWTMPWEDEQTAGLLAELTRTYTPEKTQ
jgi:predicted FMN-binding regulatory protein PaiB